MPVQYPTTEDRPAEERRDLIQRCPGDVKVVILCSIQTDIWPTLPQR